LIAPILAGLVNYALLRWVTGLIWQNDQLTSVLIFFIALVPSYPVYAFLYAFFGGWDDDTLEEVHRAASLAGFMKPLAWLFWAASIVGARISRCTGASRSPTVQRPWPRPRHCRRSGSAWCRN